MKSLVVVGFEEQPAAPITATEERLVRKLRREVLGGVPDPEIGLAGCIYTTVSPHRLKGVQFKPDELIPATQKRIEYTEEYR